MCERQIFSRTKPCVVYTEFFTIGNRSIGISRYTFYRRKRAVFSMKISITIVARFAILVAECRRRSNDAERLIKKKKA